MGPIKDYGHKRGADLIGEEGWEAEQINTEKMEEWEKLTF